MRIQVKQEHIDTGIRNNAHKCAVMLAVNDTTNDKALMASSRSRTLIVVGPRIINLPTEVTEFMRRFDDAKPVEPFEFELELEIK